MNDEMSLTENPSWIGSSSGQLLESAEAFKDVNFSQFLAFQFLVFIRKAWAVGIGINTSGLSDKNSSTAFLEPAHSGYP